MKGKRLDEDGETFSLPRVEGPSDEMEGPQGDRIDLPDS